MKKLATISKFLLIPILIIGWLFSGWPPIWQNGRLVTQTRVAFAGTAGPTNCGTAADDSTVGTVAWTTVTNACTSGQSTSAASLKSTVLSHYIKATNFGFAIPTGSAINGITVTVSKSGTQGTGSRVIVDNSVDIVKGGTIQTTQDKADTATAWPTTKTAVSYGGTADLWLLTWTVADINSSGFGVAISAKGKSTTAETATVYAFITITVTYNAPPNAPSQDSPANSATGVSITPTFLMTATDPESNSIGYKVTIYSNSACTTVVQTDDQAVSATGWTGTNATCTAAPTACYTSGTQGSFLTQTALSNSTQYWWKASAKDPDGSGTFTDSSTCNTFTTVAASTLTFTISTDNFPTITPGTPVFATSTLSVNTNNGAGWNVTLSRDTAAATMSLNTDSTVTIADQTAWAPGAATTTAGNAVQISSLDLSGNVLAFRAMTASGTQAFISTAWWGTTDAYTTSATTLWAGINSTAKQIGNSDVSCSGTNCALNTVLYYLNVPSTQKSGAYSGGITYTATMN